MSAWDKHGQKVEELSKMNKEELNVARQGCLSSLHYWQRAREWKEQVVEQARRWYEEQKAHAELEYEQAPGKIEALERRLEELDGMLARLGLNKPKPSVWKEAERATRMNQLLATLGSASATQAQKDEAAAELKRMVVG